METKLVLTHLKMKLPTKDLFICLFEFRDKSTFVGYLMPDPFSYKLTILFQTIQFSLSTKTVLFQIIQFSINTQFKCQNSPISSNSSSQFSSIWPIDFIISWKCPWCNSYRRRKWTRRHEFKFWTRLIAFHIALIPLGRYESNYSPSSYG